MCYIKTVIGRDEAVAEELHGCVAPNRYASLGVMHIEHRDTEARRRHPSHPVIAGLTHNRPYSRYTRPHKP
jgi:hypothetical protein